MLGIAAGHSGERKACRDAHPPRPSSACCQAQRETNAAASHLRTSRTQIHRRLLYSVWSLVPLLSLHVPAERGSCGPTQAGEVQRSESRTRRVCRALLCHLLVFLGNDAENGSTRP